ncbi:hypothetical protein MtrunA17_Chr4g0041891 [Medicago truncatula]|uniref:Uncharacterized protein n=1 Tax=Medicago truncatula TaxID=3880 RepID=A0A396IDX7_MEDTR|nr:pentatricopeptide repeat-containing protein At4g21880, mitochondrial [Medicago truncatula]RHN61925.1 hypothetical protein MtrunA17_Chr4g0041891 [Medicago truncatula]
MRATTTRKLCTLSYHFRSHLHNNPTKNFSSLSYQQIQQHHLDSIFNPSPQEDLSDILLGKTHPVKKLGYDEVDLEEKERRIPEVLDSHNFASLGNGKALERKQMFEDTRRVRADRIFKMVARNLGTTATDYVLDCLSPKQGLKEYNESIQSCIKKFRETDDENVSAEEMSMTYHLLKSMSENGFQLEEQTCRPILEYIIDMGLVQEFQLFYDFIKACNPSSISRLCYYEMLLWIRVNNEEKIRDICQYITVEHSKDTYALQESYLLALCQSGRILDVLKNIDMEKLTSAKPISNIFQLLGRLLLESDAENLLLDLTVSGMFVILFSYLSYSVDCYRGGKLLCF